ncbi:twin-arginine translocase TatA/TatE family subunit [Desulfuromonas thiophila]|uniref:Sec-independent protein translocase protein TatA n=1 Tax=Desulfuromonas thiophila TaxID=57664 RepID=A0A1G6WR71_9BACT|nr:twin-arginine translocase TatA/TatE family subunit [Desulfuromonas thiophila]SDD68372.1 sec-independent protein translocase protein TatB [Desulfuromonas thiophila]
MLGISMTELLVILLLALLVLGPRRLPDIARGLGRGLRELRRASDELRASLELTEVDRSAAEQKVSPAAPAGQPIDFAAPAEDEAEIVAAPALSAAGQEADRAGR